VTDATDATEASETSDAQDATAAEDVLGGGDRAGAPDAMGACDQTKPFGMQALAIGVSSMDGDSGPWLTHDELTMYFSSTRAGSRALYLTTRPSPFVPFGPPVPVLGLGPSNSDGRAALPADELTMYFDSNRGDGNLTYYSTRSSKAGAWSAPRLVPGLSPNLEDAGGPFIMPLGDVLYFHSTRLGHGHDIFRSERSDAGWSAPAFVPQVDTLGTDDLHPVLSDDELTIYFTSTRSDRAGDIWVATRRSRSDDFDPPVSVDELNTVDVFEAPGWFSPDGCRIYFTRGYETGQIYVASRPPLAAD